MFYEWKNITQILCETISSFSYDRDLKVTYSENEESMLNFDVLHVFVSFVVFLPINNKKFVF